MIMRMISKFERLEKKLKKAITQETLNYIFDVYKRNTGSASEKYPSLAEFKEAINSRGRYIVRAGSKWSEMSIMTIDDIFGCSFDPDCPSYEMKKAEVKKAMSSFAKEASEYLGFSRKPQKAEKSLENTEKIA